MSRKSRAGGMIRAKRVARMTAANFIVAYKRKRHYLASLPKWMSDLDA